MKMFTGRLANALRERAADADADRVKGGDGVTIVVAIAGAAMVLAACLFLVWTRAAQTEVGYTIHDLRVESVRLRHERAALTIEREALLRPERLALLARDELGLAAPTPARVVHVGVRPAGSP